jgi:caa(3)-type oxidase subunit IV
MAKSPLQAAEAHHDDHGGHHIHPTSMYVKTAAILTCLMIATIGAAVYDIGHFVSSKVPFINGYYLNNFIAVAIATIKLYYVVMNFMHVRWASQLGKLWAFTGFFFFFVLGVILIDYGFRHHEETPSWQSGIKESALPRQIGSKDQEPLDPINSNIQNRIPRGNLN